MNIEEKVLNVIKDQLGIETLAVDAKFADLGLDSLDAVELIMAFEDAFNVEIDDDVAQSITSVQSAVDAINKLAK
jgi:acyl carrier protein